MARDREATAEGLRATMARDGPGVRANTAVFNRGRYEAVEDMPTYELMRTRARQIKASAIERLPELIDVLVTAVEENGGTVYVAEDAADATAYIADLARARDVRSAVKSKSMTTEEIELNGALQDAGIDVVETDLGEFVIQVADERPSHLIAPAIHRTREDIAALFNDRFEPDPPLETAEELVAFAREHLLERILEADMGVTGANFVVAETGSILLVTSEGNARKCVTAPDLHVAVAGIEKVIPGVEDLEPFVELLARSGTGQRLTSYLSLLTPPVASPSMDLEAGDGRPLAEADAARDFHLVLLDNGRMRMREDPDLRETLYCIRCGACANACANFQEVGGHAFGGQTYTGGIATGWEAGLRGAEAATDFNDLCTGCSRCVEACPVGIDIPWINTVVRDRLNRGADPGRFDHLVDGLMPDREPAGLDLQKRLFGHADAALRLGSMAAPVSNWLAESAPARWLLERTVGVDRRRPLPRFARRSMHSWLASRDGLDPSSASRTALLYVDPYTDYVDVARGRATVNVLEALDVAVVAPRLGESGRAPLSQGMVTTASERIRSLAGDLDPHLADDRPLVVVEPSDLAMFRRDAARFLEPTVHQRLAGYSVDVFEFLREIATDELPLAGPSRTGVESVLFHAHCQQRTLGIEAATIEVLESVGYDVATTDVECCGMAGSFGYKREYYDLSLAVGESLRSSIEDAGVADRTVLASGTSCREQLTSLLGMEPLHPVELLAPIAGNRPS